MAAWELMWAIAVLLQFHDWVLCAAGGPAMDSAGGDAADGVDFVHVDCGY